MSPAEFERQLAKFKAQQEANLWELTANADYHVSYSHSNPREPSQLKKRHPRPSGPGLTRHTGTTESTSKRAWGSTSSKPQWASGKSQSLQTLMGPMIPKHSRPEIARHNQSLPVAWLWANHTPVSSRNSALPMSAQSAPSP